MFRYHFKIFKRTLLKNQLLTVVNITGLVLGFMVAVLVWSFVSYELSYDNSFHTGERVFRVIRNWQGSEKFGTDVPAPLAQSLHSEFPEVVAATRLYPSSNNIIFKGDRVFRDDLVLVVDSSFFEVFGISLITGSADQSPREPGLVVISQSKADILFPGKSPIGQFLSIESSDLGTTGNPYSVSGIFSDFPENSHMKPDYLVSSASGRFMNNSTAQTTLTTVEALTFCSPCRIFT